MKWALLVSWLCFVCSGLASPLHDAAVRNDVSTLRHLIDSNHYDVNGLNEAGQTPLAAAFATCINRTELPGDRQACRCTVLQYLLDAGARLDVRYQLPEGGPSLTPLEWTERCYDASRNPWGDRSVSLKSALERLREADARQRNVRGQHRNLKDTSKAYVDAKGAYKGALQLRDDDVARASYAAKYPLHAAAAANNMSEVKKLIERYALDVSAVDDKNLTPLQYGLDCDALERGVAAGYCGARITQKTAEYLVSKGANVRLDFAVRGELQRGFTLLHYAASRGSTDLVKLLLKAGADPNAVWVHKDGEGQIVEKEGSYAPLTLAAQCISCKVRFGSFPKADTCEALLDAGAKPTIPGSSKPATYAFTLPEHLPTLVSELQKCSEAGSCTAAEADAVARRFEQADFHWAGRTVPAYDRARCWHVVWKAINKP